MAMLAALAVASPGLAQEPARPLEQRAPREGVLDRLLAAPEVPWEDTADRVLIRSRETQWSRYLKAALDLPARFDLGLEQRTRFEVYDHPWRVSQPAGQTDPQIQQRTRVRFGVNGGPLGVLFEGQDSRVHLDGNDSFVDTGIVNETDILQLFVSASVKSLFDTGLRTDLHFGRLTMDFGRRRFIARNAFRNTTNAFDGVHWQLARDKAWRVRAFLVEPVLRDDVQLDKQSANSLFWGAYYENRQIPWLRLNAYYFGLNDQIPANARTFSTFGARLYVDPNKGRLDYEVEGALQTGKRGTRDHFAWFGHADLGYSFDLPWSPRVVVHYDYASGTRDPNGSQSESFDTLFGARRFELMPTGNFGPFFRRNISSPGWRVIATPARGWRVQVKHRVWYLAQARDEFAGSGLQDATGGSGNFLGHDVEVRVQWRLGENLAFDVGYDHWFKGSYFDRLPASAGLPPGGDKDTDYFYASAQLRF